MSRFIEINTTEGFRLFNTDRIVKVLPHVVVVDVGGEIDQVTHQENYDNLVDRICKLCNTQEKTK